MKTILMVFLCSVTITNAQVAQDWAAEYSGAGNSWDMINSIAVDDSGNVYVIAVSKTGGESDLDYTTIKYNSEGIQQWHNHYGGLANGDDIVYSVAADGSGNVYVTGESVGGGTLIDYATIKYNSGGSVQWIRRYNGTANGNDRARSIAVDDDGNVYVTGETDGSESSIDYATIKYNSNGDQQWIQLYNGAGNANDLGFRIAVDGSANVYVTGSSITGPGGEYDYATVKYNSEGIQQWVKEYNGPSNGFDHAFSMAVDSSGNVYVTGESGGNETFTDYATIKYNPDGVQQWVRRYAGNGAADGSHSASSIGVGLSGNVFVTGSSHNGGSADWNYATIKYDSTGAEQWTKIYSASAGSDDLAKSIFLDSVGNAYVTGRSWGGDHYDIVTIKYNSGGVEQWTQLYNGPGNSDDLGYCVRADGSGNVYVAGGSAGSGEGLDYVAIKYSQSGLKITKPSTGEKWFGGDTDTIRWARGVAGQFVSVEYSADNGSTYIQITSDTPADAGHYAWNIPKEIITTKAKIRITDVSDTNVVSISGTFKIKPYIITKVNSSGDYVAYDRTTDVWNFGNFTSHMWPQDWYNQFDYQGIDPFTGSQYSQWQADFIFATSLSSEHPDWVSWVNTFGVDACYHSTSLAIYKPSAALRWEATKNGWAGSCFGISTSDALAFTHKQQFQARYPDFPSFFSPITVVSDTGVKRAVNELFARQFGDPTRQRLNGTWETMTTNETLNEIKSMLREDSVRIRTLAIGNNNGAGGHSILAYSLEQDETQKELYYLLVYDNSVPGNPNALILIDTTGNSNTGAWLTTYAWSTWGGPFKLVLDVEAVSHLANAVLPKRSALQMSPFILADTRLEINSNINADTRIYDYLGNITGLVGGEALREIPDAAPLIYLNGSETPPYGYSLPVDNYSVVVDNFHSDTAKTFYFTGNKTFAYKRYDAEPGQTDRFFFDGGLAVVNPDTQVKTVSLLNIINETAREKLFAFSSVELTQNDSVKVENPDSNKIKLISYGTAKEYDIELNYANGTGIGRFGDFNVPLPANSSHTIVPEWPDLTSTELKILVDEGNDGTIDDTLSLTNHLTGVGNDHGSGMPSEYRLEQNYPNPFNPATTIRYELPQASHMTLKVYDVLGQVVATLVDGFETAGYKSVDWNAGNMPSGVYFCRLQAGRFLGTKKLLFLK